MSISVLTNMPSIAEAELATSVPGNFIGKGVSRETYRLPGSSWAYKIETPYGKNKKANETEWIAYNELKDTLPEGIKFPEMHLLDNGIIATEFIDGEHPDNQCSSIGHRCWIENRDRCFWTVYLPIISLVIYDGHNANIILKDDSIYIIDINDYEL